jgi:hypothetical protein
MSNATTCPFCRRELWRNPTDPTARSPQYQRALLNLWYTSLPSRPLGSPYYVTNTPATASLGSRSPGQPSSRPNINYSILHQRPPTSPARGWNASRLAARPHGLRRSLGRHQNSLVTGAVTAYRLPDHVEDSRAERRT